MNNSHIVKIRKKLNAIVYKKQKGNYISYIFFNLINGKKYRVEELVFNNSKLISKNLLKRYKKILKEIL